MYICNLIHASLDAVAAMDLGRSPVGTSQFRFQSSCIERLPNHVYFSLSPTWLIVRDKKANKPVQTNHRWLFRLEPLLFDFQISVP